MSAENEIAMEDWADGVPLTVGNYSLGVWQPSPEVAPFWTGVARKQLLLKKCSGCGRMLHPKRIVCPDCATPEPGWVRAAGTGSVYSFSEVHRAPSEQFAKSAPYTVGIVTLDEGVSLFTRFYAEPGPIAIDAPARVDFRVLEQGHVLPVFLVG